MLRDIYSLDYWKLTKKKAISLPPLDPPTMIDDHFGGSLTDKQAYRWNGKDNDEGQCTQYTFYSIA